jgi:hypothetical protein
MLAASLFMFSTWGFMHALKLSTNQAFIRSVCSSIFGLSLHPISWAPRPEMGLKQFLIIFRKDSRCRQRGMSGHDEVPGSPLIRRW